MVMPYVEQGEQLVVVGGVTQSPSGEASAEDGTVRPQPLRGAE